MDKNDGAASLVRSDALLDADGIQLVIGHAYRIASAPECANRFRCAARNDPNGTMFVRIHDGMVHLGREFIEFRDGIPYWDVSDTSNAEAETSERRE